MQTDVAVKKGDKESQFMTFIEQKMAVQFGIQQSMSTIAIQKILIYMLIWGSTAIVSKPLGVGLIF